MAYNINKEIDFLEFPTIIWDKSYETDLDSFKMLIQHVSDYMLFRNSPVFTEKNPRSNIDLFEGNMAKQKKAYENVISTFGEEGVSKMSDYKFFHNNYNAIEGLLLSMPNKVQFNNISRSHVDKKIIHGAKKAAALVRNAALQEVQGEVQHSMESMKNMEVEVPSTIQALLKELNAPDQLEYTLKRLIDNLDARYFINEELVKTNKNKFVYNSQFIFIDTDEGLPVPRAVDVNDITYLSSVEVENMDDQNIIAWSIKDHISLENALRIYGKELSADAGAKPLRDTIIRLRNGNENFTYNPRAFQINSYAISHEDNSNDIPNHLADAYFGADHFYKGLPGSFGHGINYSLLRQKLFFKVIKTTKYLVFVDGKTPSASDVKRIKMSIFDMDRVTYKKVDDDYKKKKGEFVITSPREELWTATRLGHSTIINIQKYKYQTRYEKNYNRVYPPIVGRVNKEPSFVSIGRDFVRLYNTFMFKMDELSSLSGANDILLVDEAQQTTDMATFLHNAKRVGFSKFNSTLVQDKTNRLAERHMSKVSLTPSIQSILQYLEAAKVLKATYDNMVGLSDTRMGNAGAYDGVNKINTQIEQASYLTKRYYHDDYLFRVNFYQRYADIVKQYYGKRSDTYVSAFWGNNEKEILKVTKDIGTGEYEVFLDVGVKSIQDKQFIMGLAEQGLSSGATSLKDLINIYYSDNIKESLAILSNGFSEKDKVQAQQQESQQAIMQQRVELEKAQKVDVPMKLQEMKSQTAIEIANIKENSRRDGENTRGEMRDIEEVNKRERTLLDAEIGEKRASNDHERQVSLESLMAKIEELQAKPM